METRFGGLSTTPLTVVLCAREDLAIQLSLVPHVGRGWSFARVTAWRCRFGPLSPARKTPRALRQEASRADAKFPWRDDPQCQGSGTAVAKQ